MSVSTSIEYHKLDDLLLDPHNPRLGRHRMGRLSQIELLKFIDDWTLDELAVSYIEGGGYWSHEPLFILKDAEVSTSQFVVVEGNRRLGALLLLREAVEGTAKSRKWKDIAVDFERSGLSKKGLFERIPCLRVDSRNDLDEYLGFRHVTGIKQWNPAEKAQFISMLLIDRDFSYEEVRKKIGSRTSTVKQLHIAYRILIQIENDLHEDEAPPEEELEERFSLLYSAIRLETIRDYIGISLEMDKNAALNPVKKRDMPKLANLTRCLYGVEKGGVQRFVSDTRQLEKFGKILSSTEARAYVLESTRPDFDLAYQIAGGNQEEVASIIVGASRDIRSILSTIHLYSKKKEIRVAVADFGADAIALLRHFPKLLDEILAEEE